MKKSRSLKSILMTTLCTTSFLIASLPKCHARIIPVSVLNANGGVVQECQENDVIAIQGLDITSDLYSGGDYASPHLEDTIALNTLDEKGWPSVIGGWTIQRLEKEWFSNKDQLNFAPTDTVLSFQQWMVQYNSPNVLIPINGANRYNKWVTVYFNATHANPTVVTFIKDKDTPDEIKYVFKFNVKTSSLPSGPATITPALPQSPATARDNSANTSSRQGN